MKRTKAHKRRRAEASVPDEATYFCDRCGEEIVVPIDASGGSRQQYVEDCPVCCHPNVIHVDIDSRGGVSSWGEAEVE